jgi:hypothetical protein
MKLILTTECLTDASDAEGAGRILVEFDPHDMLARRDKYMPLFDDKAYGVVMADNFLVLAADDEGSRECQVVADDYEPVGIDGVFAMQNMTLTAAGVIWHYVQIDTGYQYESMMVSWQVIEEAAKVCPALRVDVTYTFDELAKALCGPQSPTAIDATFRCTLRATSSIIHDFKITRQSLAHWLVANAVDFLEQSLDQDGEYDEAILGDIQVLAFSQENKDALPMG